MIHSNYSTLFLAVIKEKLINIHEGVLVENLSFSLKEFKEILDGKVTLSLDTFWEISRKLGISLNQVEYEVGRLTQDLNRIGFYFQFGKVEQNKDILLKYVNSFFSNKENFNVNYIPIYSTGSISYAYGMSSTFVTYCENQLNTQLST